MACPAMENESTIFKAPARMAPRARFTAVPAR